MAEKAFPEPGLPVGFCLASAFGRYSGLFRLIYYQFLG
jgi:hypothetical protein